MTVTRLWGGAGEACDRVMQLPPKARDLAPTRLAAGLAWAQGANETSLLFVLCPPPVWGERDGNQASTDTSSRGGCHEGLPGVARPWLPVTVDVMTIALTSCP